MIITKEMDYAVRIMRALADGEPHTESAICEEQEIPVHFCYRIARKLADEGLILIRRGRNGGYQIDCDLKEASLMELIDAVKEHPVISGCMKEPEDCSYYSKNGNHCNVHNNLVKLQEQMVGYFQKIKLYDLIFN